MKRVFGVEVMPAEKSCEQGCPQCPLSSRHQPINASAIDTQVQETFSLIEQKLHTERKIYDLHFTSRMDLFPTVDHPELISMARFESNKNISLPGMQEIYTTEIRNTLDLAKIDPSHVCFSFVPKSPIITQEEIAIIRKIMQDIGERFLQYGDNKKISCTIRSNFLTEKKFDSIVSGLQASDRTNLDMVLSNILPKQRKSIGSFSSNLRTESLYASTYMSRLSKKKGGHQLEVSNRAIAHKNHSDTVQKELDSKYTQSPYRTDKLVDQGFIHRWPVGVLISPDGVMINHTSLTVNNPIFWINHEDFASILSEYKQKNIVDICLKIVEQNIKIYCVLKREGIINISKKEYMYIFAEMRVKFKEYL